MAGSVCQVPTHARISTSQLRDGHRGVQGNLLVGVFPQAAWTPDRLRLLHSLCTAAVAPPPAGIAGLEITGHLPYRRPAGCHGLVYGPERSGGRSAGEPSAFDRAPGHRIRHLRSHVLGGARSAAAETAIGSARSTRSSNSRPAPIRGPARGAGLDRTSTPLNS